jgi:hypothetical protein
MLTHFKVFSVQLGMEFHYNWFILQNAMVRKLQISSQELLDVARELLPADFESYRARPKDWQVWCDIPWIVRQGPRLSHSFNMLLINIRIAKYGPPSPGVLGLELLRQSGRRSRPATIASPQCYV